MKNRKYKLLSLIGDRGESKPGITLEEEIDRLVKEGFTLKYVTRNYLIFKRKKGKDNQEKIQKVMAELR